MAQPIGPDRHDFDREERMVVDEVEKALLIDLRHLDRRFRDHVGTAFLAVDQRHFAEHAAGVDRLEHLAAQRNLDCTLRDDEHHLTPIPSRHETMAGRIVSDVNVIRKDREISHALTFAEAARLSVKISKVQR
jgi:hypothetical protein